MSLIQPLIFWEKAQVQLFPAQELEPGGAQTA